MSFAASALGIPLEGGAFANLHREMASRAAHTREVRWAVCLGNLESPGAFST